MRALLRLPLRSQAACMGRRLLSQQAASTALLFPGQGAQTVGMTKEELRLPAVQKMYDLAKDVLGYDLQQIVIDGPQSQLDTTVHCQPAMLVAGLAAVEKLRALNPKAIAACRAAAGLSLGEYTALVFAGALSLEDALRVVKVRAAAMQAASDASTGVMLSIAGVADDAIQAACATATQATSQEAIIANWLAPGLRVVSGHKTAVEHVYTALEPSASQLRYLPVSGAFHSTLMSSAVKPLAEALDSVSLRIPTTVTVYANTTGRAYRSADEIRQQLQQQVCRPVAWETGVRAMLADGHTQLYELGPQRQLKTMLRKIDAAAFKHCVNVTV